MGFGLAFLSEPVAIAADVDHGAAMQQAVQSGRRHDGVAGEDLAPVREGLVAGEEDGLLHLVAFADGLEHKTGVRGFQGEVANLVDDEQVGAGKIFDLAGETVFRQGFGHAACQFDGRGDFENRAAGVLGVVVAWKYRQQVLTKTNFAIPMAVRQKMMIAPNSGKMHAGFAPV